MDRANLAFVDKQLTRLVKCIQNSTKTIERHGARQWRSVWFWRRLYESLARKATITQKVNIRKIKAYPSEIYVYICKCCNECSKFINFNTRRKWLLIKRNQLCCNYLYQDILRLIATRQNAQLADLPVIVCFIMSGNPVSLHPKRYLRRQVRLCFPL